MNELNCTTFVDLVESYLFLGHEIPLDTIKADFDKLSEELDMYCTATPPSYEKLRLLEHAKAEFELLKYHKKEIKFSDRAIRCPTYFYVLSLVYKMEKFIAIECDILHMQINTPSLSFKSIELSWMANINDLLELCSALFVSKVIFHNGLPATFADIVAGFENLFGIKVESKGKKRLRLFDRLNMTSFLDKLKSAFVLDADSKL